MAYENPILTKGTLAAADLRTLIHTAVKLDTNGKTAAVSVAGEAVYGVLQNKPNTDQECSVMVSGITRMIASEAIPRLSKIGVTAAGRARVARSGDHVIGQAQDEAATANGDIIPVRLTGAGQIASPFLLDGVAGADLSAATGLAVKFDGAGLIILASVAGENCLGFLQTGVANGAACKVIQGGYHTAVSGAGFTRGAKLATMNNGKLEAAGTGDHVLGIALATAGGADVQTPIFVALGGAPLP